MEEKIYSIPLAGGQRFVLVIKCHHRLCHETTTIITVALRSVVVEEGVVTADGLAVDWVGVHPLFPITLIKLMIIYDSQSTSM